MKEYRFTIRMTEDDVAEMNAAMKKHKIRKRSQLVRVALRSLNKEDSRKERGEVVVSISKDLWPYLRLEKTTGHRQYGSVVESMVRRYVNFHMDDIKRRAKQFREDRQTMVDFPMEEEEEILE